MAASRIHSNNLALEGNVTIVRTDASPTRTSDHNAMISNSVNTLFPLSADHDRGESDGDSRYYTASSGDEKYYDDDEDDDYIDDDDDDDGMCIMLDSDNDETGSLSGLHINLETLQAVSNMLAHYTPIIQRDSHGNPVFVPPPPPEDYDDITPIVSPCKAASNSRDNITSTSSEVAEELQSALQELENILIAEEDTFLVDKMNELTEVMEKMANCAAEEAEQFDQAS